MPFKPLLFVSMILLQPACQKSDDDKTDTDKALSLPTALNLQAVARGISPPALSNRPSGTLDLKNQGTDPCAGFSHPDPFRNFLVCQPTLLANFMEQARSFVEEMAFVAEEAGTQLQAASDGQSGSITTPEGDTIGYSKTDADTFSLLLKTGETKIAQRTADGSTISFFLDGWYLEDLDSYEGDLGRYGGTLVFQSDNDWQVDLFLAGISCNPLAADNPERFKLLVNFKDGLWTGKAMTYHPRKSGEECTTDSESSRMNVYTEFVGDETATKANVFMLNHTVTDLGTLANYQLGKFCVNYPAICNGSTDYSADQTDPVSIPFCATAVGQIPQWGNTCQTNLRVSQTGFTSQEDWEVPSEFYQKELPAIP